MVENTINSTNSQTGIEIISYVSPLHIISVYYFLKIWKNYFIFVFGFPNYYRYIINSSSVDIDVDEDKDEDEDIE